MAAKQHPGNIYRFLVYNDREPHFDRLDDLPHRAIGAPFSRGRKGKRILTRTKGRSK